MFVITGSSGNTGSVVADTLLNHGKKVRLTVRRPGDGAAFAARGAELIEADFEDHAAMTRALRGAEGVYLLLPPAMMSPDVMAMHARVTASFVRAVADAKPRHVVLLSAQGAHREAPMGPIASLRAAEQALSAVTEHLTCVRPTYFMENIAAVRGALSAGIYPTFFRADLSLPLVATRDIGQVAAAALLRGGRGRSVIELAGPRSYTPTEVAGELASVLDKPVQVQHAPESAVVPTLHGMGMPREVAELSEQLFHAFNAGIIEWELPEQQRTQGTTTLREVAQRLVA